MLVREKKKSHDAGSSGSKPRRSTGFIASAAGVVIAVSQVLGSAVAQDEPSAPDVATPAYTEEGTERCLLCHSDLRMNLISETPHGDTSNPKTPFAQRGCESCHGPGSFHVTRSRRGQGRPPMITFGDGAATPREQQIQVCMDCHVADIDELLQIPAHANAREAQDMMELSCSSCHTIHQVGAELAEQAAVESAALSERLSKPAEFTARGTQQCLLCHVEQRMHLMAETVHGDVFNTDTPYGQHGCESCHGKGSLHVSASRSGGARPAMITFGEDASTSTQEQMQTCMSCHRRDWNAMLAVEAHRKAVNFEGVSCATCHTMHPFPDSVQAGLGAPAPAARFTDRGAEHCLLCHSEDRMAHIVNTPHGDRENPHSPFARQECESCHGPGSVHVSQSIGKGRPPMIAFGRTGRTPLTLQTETCLGCHDNHADGFTDLAWQDMVHGGDGTCTDCHSVHAEDRLLNDQSTGTGVCLGCHDEAGGEGPLIAWTGSMHANDQVSCRSCHTVHVAGSLLGDPLAQTQNCAACHADPGIVRATMAWQGSVHANNELTCGDCHTLHTEYNALRDRQVQADVCYECHRSQRNRHPRFEESAIRFERLNCSSCHDVHQLIARQTDGESLARTAMEQQ